MVLLAGRAVRGVALGVVVTAIVQSVFGGLALAIAGVPFAMLLTGVMFLHLHRADRPGAGAGAGDHLALLEGRATAGWRSSSSAR